MFLKRTVFIQCYLKYPPLLSSCPYFQKGYTHSLSKPSLICNSFLKFSWILLNTNKTIFSKRKKQLVGRVAVFYNTLK